MSKLIFGCGYLGGRVAQRWRALGNDVVVVSRSPERAVVFKQHGYAVIMADVTQPSTLIDLPAAETVLFAIGCDRTTGQSIEDVYAGGMRNVLAALPSGTGRMVYISTTGVYGDTGGDWIDEETPPDPQRDGGRASLAAERVLAEHPLGRNAVVLRLAGIYGPGRIPFRSLLRAGAPIPAPSDGNLNLIHVVDAAAVVLAAADGDLGKSTGRPHIYCVSDGHPVERGDYYREVACRIGAAPPEFVVPDADSPRAARAAQDRKVRNERMLAELGVQLTYPDYRAGLAAILG
jgi:nucleoside-diphosphate-sugar epimerase